MVADLAAFTAQGSASDDLHALEACLTWLRAWLDRRLGAPESEEVLPHEDAGDILIRRYPARDAVTAGHARAHLDVRVATAAEQQRISRALAGLRPVDPRTRLEPPRLRTRRTDRQTCRVGEGMRPAPRSRPR
ncbi:hypothetical protein FB570_12061 [Streptomyces sp. T12]|nr:hypothetical protein FB570_12061 [Streptomyces sp. T12]